MSGIQMAPGKHFANGFCVLFVCKCLFHKCKFLRTYEFGVSEKLSSSKCSTDCPFSVPSNLCHCSDLAWLWSGEANICASMLWHRDYHGQRPFAAPLTSFYLHMLETAGPVWAIPLKGVKIIPGPWEESCLLIQFHAHPVSKLPGRYI